jgi:hypothetical protein
MPMRKTARNMSRPQQSRKIRRRKGGAPVNIGWARRLVLENEAYGMANECSVKDNGNKLKCLRGGWAELYGTEPYTSIEQWNKKTNELYSEGINVEKIKLNYRMSR